MSRQEPSNLDYAYLQHELRTLQGAFLNKVHELRPGLFRLQFHTRGEGRADLLAELGARAHLTRRLEDAPAQPTRFASLLRARLGNARLLGVEQLDLDRVLLLRFETKDGERSLALELMKPGNLLLLDERRVILDAWERREFESRALKRGAPYQPPPGRRLDPRTLGPHDLEGGEGLLASALARRVNLSSFYLAEACARAGLAGDRDARSLDHEELGRLARTLNSLAGQPPEPRLYRAPGGSFAHFSPFALRHLDLPAEPYPSFSEALDAYFAEPAVPVAAPAGARTASRERERIERALEGLRQSIARVEARAMELQEAGHALFSQAERVDRALSLAREHQGRPAAEIERLIARETGLRVRWKEPELELELEG